MRTELSKMPSLLVMGWLSSLLGLIYAVTIGNGSELPRLAFILPFMVFGVVGLFCTSKGRVCGACRTEVWTQLGILGVAGYFLLRGAVSPVWDLARRDLFLVVSGCLAFVVASSALKYKGGRVLLLGVVILLVFLNGIFSLMQLKLDEELAFLRGGRVDRLGVSGFYYHRNYLAGFLEISFPVIIAVCVSFANCRKWLVSLHFGLWATTAGSLCFLTNSRGGFGVMIVGGLVAFALELLGFARNGVRARGEKKRFWVFCIVILGCILIAGGGSLLLMEILDNRGGSVDGALNWRLRMAGVAMDAWLQNRPFGMGAETYSYLFPKLFSGSGSWYGDAGMAHSDYLQLLSDYGIVGLFLVFCLIVGIAGRLLRKAADASEPEVGEGGSWLRSAAFGALIAEVLRAAFDFNLHIAPNLILFAIVMAGGVNAGRNVFVIEACSKEVKRHKLGKSSQLGALLLVMGMSCYGLWAGWREIIYIGDWGEVEKLQASGESSSAALRAYSEKAPSFEVLKSVAQKSLIVAIEDSSIEAKGFSQAKEDWRRVVERHPYDGEGLANYARCLDEVKAFSEAERFHLRALLAVSSRENKYGVIYGVGWHLAKRGEDALISRRSEEALFLFQSAEGAFQESFRRNFSRESSTRLALLWTKGRIQFLKGARIEPVEVPVLDWRAHIE